MLQTNESGSGGAATHRVGDLHLEAAGVVLQQDRQQAVVGVLADAPDRRRRRARRRVVEDAEEHERVGGVGAREPVAARGRGRARCRA